MKTGSWTGKSARSTCLFFRLALAFAMLGHVGRGQDSGADSFAGDHSFDGSDLLVVEHDDRDVLLHAVVHGLRVHDLQVLLEHILERDVRITDRMGVFLGIVGVDAVHAGSLEHDIGVDLAGTKGGRGVGTQGAHHIGPDGGRQQANSGFRRGWGYKTYRKYNFI